ncbi:hypothetical protein PF005_g13109 [Phytophthora fragariae]|uniref:Uncharacterized protein n=1 Tax=Phytophthora fragariae TaxID=53985 RepID=A0A6A3YTL7_9STRA|nr:hypothetical protein PF009_g13849 [Phytophthora fragariae]KAE9105432.1 hypothetical protein PF007_g13714 [Phytophthora fragariae]KAE9118318.1 hypothetical protein PF010_g8268 [Phytophthora fragariae]KAE9133912.1 hypothetical protein PF006_g14930 [Phytophthora fragariae]KAE9206182.1 hypothetical protein PF005_g13109 [Phytophthora fragariae]
MPNTIDHRLRIQDENNEFSVSLPFARILLGLNSNGRVVRLGLPFELLMRKPRSRSGIFVDDFQSNLNETCGL